MFQFDRLTRQVTTSESDNTEGLRACFRDASAFDTLCAVIGRRDPAWLRAMRVDAARDPAKAPSLAGEMRAYHQILLAWPDTVQPNPRPEGADFLGHLGETNVLLEVTTPRGRSSEDRTVQAEPEHVEQLGDIELRTRVRAFAPLGFPKRPVDNVQGEAVSWLAGKLKPDEHQALSDACSILWVDLQHPSLEALSSRAQLVPVSSAGPALLMSGAIWFAFYGCKGDEINGCVALDSSEHPSIYTMEFDGRFQNGSNFDFAIIDHPKALVVLENVETARYSALAKRLLWLHRAELALSWLNWPTGDLEDRVSRARDLTNRIAEGARQGWGL